MRNAAVAQSERRRRRAGDGSGGVTVRGSIRRVPPPGGLGRESHLRSVGPVYLWVRFRTFSPRLRVRATPEPYATPCRERAWPMPCRLAFGFVCIVKEPVGRRVLIVSR